MDIEQALRAMAPLPEEELRIAFGVRDAPWPPPLTAADVEAARGSRFACWIPEEEWATLLAEPGKRGLAGRGPAGRGARRRGAGALRGGQAQGGGS